MNAHFGLGSADIIDSLIVKWQDGSVQAYYDVDVNQKLDITKLIVSTNSLEIKHTEATLYPNPSSSDINIDFESTLFLSNPICEIINANGQLIDRLTESLRDDKNLSFSYSPYPKLSSGTYFALLTNEGNKVVSLSFVIH